MPNPFSRLFGSRRDPDWIETAELAPMLGAPEGPLIVDVRSPAEFTGPLGHIEGAINIPIDQFADRAPEAVAPGRPTVLVCHTDRRSAAAAHHLRSTGHTNVAVLRGGMTSWTQSGQPVQAASRG